MNFVLLGLVDYKLDMALIVEERAPLWNAVNKMVDYGVHRILVIDDFGDVQNIITQSRILQTLSTIVDSLPKNRFTLKELGNHFFQIKSTPFNVMLGLGRKEVISVRDDQTAYEAFKLMKDQVHIICNIPPKRFLKSLFCRKLQVWQL